MKLLLITTLFLSGLTNGCCPKSERIEPPYPSGLIGWSGRVDKGGFVVRDFVLRKGESTGNGNVEVRLLELLPGDSCTEAGDFRHLARARIQFISAADKKILCEDVFGDSGTSTLSATPCRSDPQRLSLLANSGVQTVYANINLQEAWVYLQLRGDH